MVLLVRNLPGEVASLAGTAGLGLSGVVGEEPSRSCVLALLEHLHVPRARAHGGSGHGAHLA